MPGVTLILGGARSGKSARALRLATEYPRSFVATAEAFDEEMRARIELHKSQRGPEWNLIEAPLEIASIVRDHQSGTLVIDCLTIWLSNLMHYDRDIGAETSALISALDEVMASVILVSNEVGLSIAPENAMARAFRDLQGRLNQDVAAIADHVEFIAAGLPLTLKGAP